MHEKYLGDSFDIVKRFWAERLSDIAPLFAHPRFVATELRPAFQRMTAIPILPSDGPQLAPFGLFLDPHTGIPLPSALRQQVTSSHAPLSFIERELDRLDPLYLICYDQSHDRDPDMGRIEQRERKRAALHAKGISCFYYVSHAPFLFAARDTRTIARILARLVESGIPRSRFEPTTTDGKWHSEAAE